ncbi:hypothetical protein Ppha_0428 [Pelodictyon phaeoclathratiforme BU-1]|jgi:hypothetical protein|uniref:Uncharacterized protein n=1 Tax=Pelodictyon phaeoclathratiforme (strain DSM 5477 / BU-1) TaxID=324925 RepID=B4SCS0_PELPB|nr:hypothetical protein Ppha_0428 [Pelodictyon phaeoclathratiforme BU-1]
MVLEYRNLLILVSLALLVPILTAHLFALVYRHFMTFSLFSAGHIVSVFPLVLKADNIETFFRTANNYSYSFHKMLSQERLSTGNTPMHERKRVSSLHQEVECCPARISLVVSLIGGNTLFRHSCI